MLTLVKTFSFTAALSLLLPACGGGGREEPTPVPPSHPLNDTGVTHCYSPDNTIDTCPSISAPAQDAQFGRDARAAQGQLKKIGGGAGGFDFSKRGETGERLAVQNQPWQNEGTEAAGSRWSCVEDHVTGLLWEVKHDNSDSPQHFNHTYSWYQPDTGGNAGVAGVENGGSCGSTIACDTFAYTQYLNTIRLCGRQNWRLPSVNELLSIIHQGQPAPPLDTAYFPNASLNAYWTSQSVAQVPDKAWYVYFTAGSSGNIDKTSRAHLRLVSDAP